jgi:hypothetical protein
MGRTLLAFAVGEVQGAQNNTSAHNRIALRIFFDMNSPVHQESRPIYRW